MRVVFTGLLSAVLEEFGGSSKTVTAFVGGAAILPCTVPYSVPIANISLKKKGAARKVGPQSRQLLTSGSFYVQGLRARDAGMYRCLADNDMTGTRTRSPFVTLQVEGQYAGHGAGLDSLGQHYAGVCTCIVTPFVYDMQRRAICL